MCRIFNSALFVLLAVCSIAVPALADEDGFDAVCDIHTDALDSRQFERLTPEEQAAVLQRQVISRVAPGPALKAYQSVAEADPRLRYSLFKDAAEYALGRAWDCPAMQVMSFDAPRR